MTSTHAGTINTTNKNNMRNRSVQRTRTQRNRGGSNISPPQRQSNVLVNHTYRFETAGSATQSITDRDLLAAAGCVCTVNNSTLTSIFQSVKLNSIEIWSATTPGDVTTISLLWGTDASVGNTTKEVSDTSISNAFPAHIFSRPPQGSFASFWQSGTTENTMFTIVCSIKCIVDVNMTCILNDGTSSSATVTVASAALGAVYYAPLDGSTDDFTPVGLTTAT